MKSGTGRVLLLLAVALALRLVLAMQAPQWESPALNTGLEEVRLAQRVAEGEGFTSPFWKVGEYPSYPSAHSPPAFPYLLAGLLRGNHALGLTDEAAFRQSIVLATLVGALTVLLLAEVGRRIVGWGGFWAVGLVATTWPTLVQSTASAWDTPYTLLGQAAALWLCTSSPPTSWRWPRLTLIGMVTGLFGLFNPVIAPFMGLAVLLWLASGLGWRRAMVPCAVVATIAVAVVSPWLVRDALAFHRFVPIRNNFGLELWIGNHPGADGTTQTSTQWHPSDDAAERALAAQVGDDRYMQQKAAEARAMIRAEPGRFLTLTVRRVGLFWLGNPTRPSRVMGRAIPMRGGVNIVKLALNVLLLSLALTGLWRWPSGRGKWLVAFGLATLPLLYYVTHVSPNYRSLVDPLLCLLAGLAIARLASAGDPAPTPR